MRCITGTFDRLMQVWLASLLMIRPLTLRSACCSGMRSRLSQGIGLTAVRAGSYSTSDKEEGTWR